MKNYFYKKNKGFTLVETLVAISVLSLSILATFTAVQGSLQSSSTAKDQIAAFYLAQEGMEFIKNIRDENALNSVSGIPTSWMHGMTEQASDPCFFGKTCRVDSPAKTIVECGTGFDTCPNLGRDVVSGLFGYAVGGTETIFKRGIQFTQINADEVLVTIRISWTSRGQAKTFQVSQSLFNRQ